MSIFPIHLHLTITLWDVVFFFVAWSIGTYLRALLGCIYKDRRELWRLTRAAVREVWHEHRLKKRRKQWI